MKYIISFPILILAFFSFQVKDLFPLPGDNAELNNAPEFLNVHQDWVDTTLANMSMDEKIGQLFMIAAYSNKSESYTNQFAAIIERYKPGGLIFFQGTPKRQAILTNYFQTISKYPLLIAMDAEWGPSMRLDSTPLMAQQMQLGAITDNMLIYDYGAEVARQLKLLGVHINFAPVVDINNNPRNPVINSRSFGENRENVLHKSYAYMLGLQKNNILAVAKHFPGHGDTDTDSHHTLPIIAHKRNRLDSLELYPFRQLITNGLGGVMVAHLHIPALDSTRNLPSTLSRKIVTGLLKDELGFEGLVFTDALGMEGVNSWGNQAAIALKAIMAGNDVLLMPNDLGAAIAGVKDGLARGIIDTATIDQKVRKILQVKYWTGAYNPSALSVTDLNQQLNSPEAELINRLTTEASLTVVKDENQLIPLKRLDTLRIASLSIGDGTYSEFEKTTDLYAKVEHFAIHKNANAQQWLDMENKLAPYNLILVIIGNTQKYSRAYGVTENSLTFVQRIAHSKKVVLSVLGNAYILNNKLFPTRNWVTIVAYDDTPLTRDYTAQLIFGGIAARGKLPVSAGKYKSGTGVISAKTRLKYSIPEELGIKRAKLSPIDSIVNDAILRKAMPGCQILGAKDGIVFFHKAYGYHTYDTTLAVTLADLYDVASLTKILGSVPAIMYAYEKGYISIEEKLSTYLPALDTTNKKDITVKQVLTHQARLKAWIPFYLHTFEKNGRKRTNELRKELYSEKPDSIYSLEVARGMYLLHSYVDTMLYEIYESKLNKRSGYLYSDLGFFMLKKIVEEKSGMTYDVLLDTLYFSRLGAYTMGYNPAHKYPLRMIPPTEEDKYFRKQLIQGYVHDFAAAMMGGVAGHAGIFSNANDIAKFMEMYLQEGTYGGEKYVDAATFRLFNSQPYERNGNRRALGFDKTSGSASVENGVCSNASGKSFGHTGFTGTIAWADPVCGMNYVFLSNRIYPTLDNELLQKMYVRQKIQKVFYSALNGKNQARNGNVL